MLRLALPLLLILLASSAVGQHWEHELVDAGGRGPWVSMKRGPDGLLYLCYTGTNGRTTLAWEDSVWRFEDVPQEVPTRGCFPAFAFGPQGEVAVTYSSSQACWLSVRHDSAWSCCSIPFVPRSDWPMTPVAFDSHGRATVALTFDPFGSGGWVMALGLARLLPDSTWSVTDTVTSGSHGPRFYVVGFGSKSDLSLWGTYVRYVYDIGYLYMGMEWFEWRGRWETGYWFGSSPASVGPACGGVDGRNAVHAAYYGSDTTNQGFWFDREVIDGTDAERVALAFDSLDRPFIAMAVDSVLKFCHRDRHGWHLHDVGATQVEWVAVAAAPDCQPLVAYQTPFGLYLARGIGIVGVEDDARPELTNGGRGMKPTILRGPELTKLDCRVLDIQGRDVTERKRSLSPGVYFLEEGRAENGSLPNQEQSRIRGFKGSRVAKVVVTR